MFDNNNIKIVTLDNIVDIKGGKRLPKEESFSLEGVPYIRAEDVKNSFVDYVNSPKISLETFKKIKKYQTKKNDILLTIVGNSIGDVGMVLFELEFCNLTENCVRLISKNLIPEYLFSYFLSKYGKKQINREKVGTAQPKLAIERIKRFKIFEFNLSFQQRIKEIVNLAYMKLEESKQLYKQAEQFLNKKLGLDNFKPSIDNISIRKFSEYEKINRLDAEYYQPKYDEIIKLINKQKKDILMNIVNIKKSIEPGSDAYVEEGIPFVRVSDLNKFEIQEPEIKISKVIEPNIEKLYPKKDTILLSKDGSIGVAYKVEKDLDIVTSGALLHLTIKNKEKVLPDYLTLVLNSLAIQLQAEQSANGAVIKHWKPEDIKNMVIPLLDFEIQQQIAEIIQESFKLRKQSKDLLDLAKQVVETAIEKDETEALKLINNHASEKDEYMNNYNKDISMAAEDTDKFKSKN